MASPIVPKIEKAKPRDPARSSAQYYVRLMVNKGRRLTLGVLVAGAVLAFAYVIHHDTVKGKGWLLLGAPLCLVGLGFLVFPETEAWEYVPWQAKPEQYEKHIIG